MVEELRFGSRIDSLVSFSFGSRLEANGYRPGSWRNRCRSSGRGTSRGVVECGSRPRKGSTSRDEKNKQDNDKEEEDEK